MRKIIVTGDTHVESFKDLPPKLVTLMNEADIVVHTGDFTGYELYRAMHKKYNLRAVSGNLDDERIKTEVPAEVTFEVEDLRFGVVHAGNYLNEFHDLGYRAKELGVDVLFFGHVHRFVVERFGDVVVISPGSPTIPRLSAASCAEVFVNGRKLDVKFKLVQDVVCGVDVKSYD
ncbi:YfcE family phosphodiesterase [Archaeoglobus veneficus]|uniref:Phosphoesterase n=1 Tax=Archaeoglobus veneficus (strain DSM 11195 / SNP6) TaxID=693661 RepID=F2KNH9_ARCVS|nr:metallophosphoesterase [Archaeoglobus veneficus]AEA47381.1 phosphodiesterase, MJ0936 family [Archaeoglobus veneficus SNP6]